MKECKRQRRFKRDFWPALFINAALIDPGFHLSGPVPTLASIQNSLFWMPGCCSQQIFAWDAGIGYSFLDPYQTNT